MGLKKIKMLYNGIEKMDSKMDLSGIMGLKKRIKVQPTAFGVSFLRSQISIDDLVL